MLTTLEIQAGTDRLTAGKLKEEDVTSLVLVFRVLFAGLEESYDYKFKEKLLELSDIGNTEKRAAQVAAILIKLQNFGFGVSELTGQRGAGVKFKEMDRYIEHVLFAFASIYPVPAEFSKTDIKRAILLGSYESSVGSYSGSLNAERV